MITYKYKLYKSKRNRGIDSLLREACFVWNHCLALQKRYYSLFGRYANANRMKTHFAKWYKMGNMHSQSVQEVIERHDRDLLAANNMLRRGIDELGDKINPQPSRAAVFVKS